MSFYRSQFLEDVREVMGIPDWFLTIDSRKTTMLHNGACVQLLIHFKGNNIKTLICLVVVSKTVRTSTATKK